jgi:hypothetical protein
MDGSVYVANAYQSLAAASERPGAPLCGSVPVWRDEEFGLVQTRRISGTTPTTLESLFLQGGTDLVPMHGENTIRIDQAYFGWSKGSWLQLPQGSSDLFGNATARSKAGRSHLGDSTVTVARVEVNDSVEIYQVLVNGTLLAEVRSTWAKKPSASSCVRADASFNCLSSVNTWYNRVMSSPALGFSPNGDEVVLAISKQQSTYSVGPFYTCFATNYCRDHELDVTTLASELVFVGIADGQIRERQAGPIRRVEEIGYSDDGRRLVLGQWYLLSNNTNTPTESYTTSTSYCDASYRTRTGTRLFTLPLKRTVAHCYKTATFSP